MYGTTISETSFRIAWQKAIKFVLKSPEKRIFGGGKERKEILDSQVDFILNRYAVEEALRGEVHPSDPFATPLKLNEYLKEYKKGFDSSVFDYTYRDRLENAFVFDQLEYLKIGLSWQLEDKISSNRNVAILFNPEIDYFSDKSKPCFNEVLVRWERDNYVSVHTLFRSHDLAQAWEANMYCITNLLYDEVIKPNNCKILYWSEKNFSLHIHTYNIPEMSKIKILSRSPMFQHIQDTYDNY